ncbi:MAG: M67 family metallopeptidase, partial [Gammaproteobacteria bacterium]|nr:M67 family metallopeptidase [Gammaproteobacteria bacterium]
MTIRLTNDVYEKIQRHGEKDYPHECCGFLIGRVQDGERIVEEIREQKNERNTSQTTRFLISPKAFKDAEDYARDTDQEMLGIYHS